MGQGASAARLVVVNRYYASVGWATEPGRATCERGSGYRCSGQPTGKGVECWAPRSHLLSSGAQRQVHARLGHPRFLSQQATTDFITVCSSAPCPAAAGHSPPFHPSDAVGEPQPPPPCPMFVYLPVPPRGESGVLRPRPELQPATPARGPRGRERLARRLGQARAVTMSACKETILRAFEVAMLAPEARVR